MAYTYYNNIPYYQPYQQAFQNPVPAPPSYQQSAPTQQPIQTQPPSSLIWVSSDRDAAMYPTAPNNAVALWNQNEPVVYLKQADASGKPSMKTYDLVERVEQPAEATKPDGGKDHPYASKEDVATLANIVKGFDSVITAMKSEIEKMSGDLYGIAGKKKTKKAEETEES